MTRDTDFDTGFVGDVEGGETVEEVQRRKEVERPGDDDVRGNVR